MNTLTNKPPGWYLYDNAHGVTSACYWTGTKVANSKVRDEFAHDVGDYFDAGDTNFRPLVEVTPDLARVLPLQNEIAALLPLIEKATPGDWTSVLSAMHPPIFFVAVGTKTIVGEFSKETDADFVAAAYNLLAKLAAEAHYREQISQVVSFF